MAKENRMKKILSYLILSIGLVAGQSYAWTPKSPVSVVIPAPPGSLHDASFRSVSEQMESKSNFKFSFDYKPGAAGIIGTNHFLDAAKANPDGTLLVAASLSHSLSTVSKPDQAKWDIANDFQYIGELVVNTLAITVSTTGAIKTIDDLIAEMKKDRKAITVGITFPNQKALMLDLADRVKVDHKVFNFVNYPTPIKAVTDLVGGQIELVVGGVPPTVGMKDAGKVDWIAITSKNRLEFLPNVPALHERFPGLVQVSVASLIASKDMSKEAVEFYRNSLKQALFTDFAKAQRAKKRAYLEDDLLDPENLKMFHVQTLKDLGPKWKKLLDK